MSASRLTPLQGKILRSLSGLVPPFTLTGGGALAAVHTKHRDTRDLDLFWQAQRSLDNAPAEVKTLAEAPVETDVDGARILVDTPHQIFVNKLCALLSRSELRDLEDVEALLGAGADLTRGLSDSAAQDGGFSPLTFAWVLRELPIAALAKALGRTPESTASAKSFRDQLVDRVLALSLPK